MQAQRKQTGSAARLRVQIRGAVQGVGFRPFVFRLATELGLCGWVNNSPQGVQIEVEGARPTLDAFLLRLETELPPRAFIQSLEPSLLDPRGYVGFEIRPSETGGQKTALVLPDAGTCEDCLRDIRDPANRRYRYPFTNCTNCGPRFSIIEALPYDRANTTMRGFAMCDACAAEYHDPRDRRFHAQPNACPDCGPQLVLWDETGNVLAERHAALFAAAEAIRAGQIVAVKGLGGFHLMVDARDDAAVRALRQRKYREEKPFAVMFPALAAVEAECAVTPIEARLLRSPEAPIVLLQRQSAIRNPQSAISSLLAPGNPYLGVLLPYTPLHHLLLAELQFPVVATSGNLSDEPICTDEHEALERLHGIADLFLVHNRPIARHVDDSIARVLAGREAVLRRARGYAPLPIHLPQTHLPQPTHAALATGAHLKNTVALAVGNAAFVSQHIGDLETAQAYAAFQHVISSFERLYETPPQAVACDAHPDYLSTQYARALQLPTQPVQHHLAHVLACVAENEIELPVLGVAWDGTGYGLDGTIWGGEFLRVTKAGFERAAHFRTFALPGGDSAIRRPRRIALGLLYEIFGDELFAKRELSPVRACTKQELDVLRAMLQRQLNCPRTSSAGRLFDAVAALLGLRQEVCFEGQAALELEFAATETATDETYPFRLTESALRTPHSALLFDWEPLMRALLDDVCAGQMTNHLAAKFHNTLADAIVALAERIGEARVALSGGCFQNKYLLERAVQQLQSAGFRPYWHQRIPPNDGGIALGQLAALALWPKE
ncbi:MAG: carbamoyltransferase HypF [Acidobacteria bacterium]|nr:carbamoyltransferase HypF [Acidobacteriota bacterium]